MSPGVAGHLNSTGPVPCEGMGALQLSIALPCNERHAITRYSQQGMSTSQRLGYVVSNAAPQLCSHAMTRVTASPIL